MLPKLMPAALKQRPANDLHPRASQQIPWVVMPRRYWNRNRVVAAIAAACVAFAGMTAISYASRTQSSPAPTVIAVVARPKISQPQPVQNYDITLNVPVRESKPQDDKLPNDIPSQLMDLNVEDGIVNKTMKQALPLSHSPGTDTAQELAVLYRAAQLQPANMLFRLRLAVLYDRAGKSAGAVQLYHQVLEAYDQQEITLPSSINIDSIRRRVAYLALIKE